MILSEHRLRSFCKTSDGAIEAEQFEKALKLSNEDPVTVEFDINGTPKKIEIPRDECEYYAQIAKEEAGPQKELLKTINPEMHWWIKYNREKMCDKIREGILKYKEEHKIPGQGVVIAWPLFPPDQVSIEAAEKYLSKYSSS